MNKIRSDIAWEDYLYRQTQDKKLLNVGHITRTSRSKKIIFPLDICLQAC